MDLLDLLNSTGGGKSVSELGSSLGLGTAETGNLVSTVAPALLRALQKQMATDDGLEGVSNALATGGHTKYIENPELMHASGSRDDGNNILGHIFGSKDVSRNVAAHASRSSGIDAGLIKKALPLLAGLAMGAMNKKTDAGQGLSGRSAGSGAGLLGALIDQDSDGVDLDDVIGLARKFF